MTDIYLEGESERQKSGRWRWWAALLLLLGLSGLGSYAYLRLEAPNAAREQAGAVSAPGASPDCAWLPWLRARHEGAQTCPAGSYVNGVGLSSDDGFRHSYPLQYRLYCCALVPADE